jgi:HK97 family phage major capsid protein
MADSTILKLRKLKGNDGQYLWQPGLVAGQPDILLSHPLYTSDTMPAAEAGKKAVLFGDFKRYRILDRKGLYFQRLNEIAALNGQVGFLAYRRYDGALLNTDAIKTLTMKSA